MSWLTAVTPRRVDTAGEIAVERQRTGTDNALLGVLLFIASEAMFFAALFGAYFNARADRPEWPPAGFDLEIGTAALLTATLVISSFTMQYGVRRIRAGDRRGMVVALAVTVVLGVLFLGGQLLDYATLGFGPGSGTYGALFFTMTGFHGAHVAAGVVAILAILWRGLDGQFSARHHTAVEAVSAYWHFVDVVWICLFATLYLLR
jgi:cytochrome c oxidase subunit 3